MTADCRDAKEIKKQFMRRNAVENMLVWVRYLWYWWWNLEGHHFRMSLLVVLTLIYVRLATILFNHIIAINIIRLLYRALQTY